MAKTDTQISCRVTHEFKARLEAQAARERRSVSNLIIKILSDYLEAAEAEETQEEKSNSLHGVPARARGLRGCAERGRRSELLRPRSVVDPIPMDGDTVLIQSLMFKPAAAGPDDLLRGDVAGVAGYEHPPDAHLLHLLQRQRQNPRSIPLSAVGGRDAVCQMTAVDEVGVIEIMPDGGGPRRRANCASWRQRPPRRPAGEAPGNR